MTKTIYYLPDLDCANCAAKIETAVGKLPFVESCNLNFTMKKMVLESEGPVGEREDHTIRDTILSYESVQVQTEAEYLAGQEKGHAHEHGHSHAHGHEHTHGKPGLKQWIPLMVGGGLFVLGLVMPWGWVKMALFVAAAAVAGFESFKEAFAGLAHLRIDENLLMCLAVVAAFVIGLLEGSAEEFSEGAMVTLLFVLGEQLEGLAVSRSQRQISALTAILPEEATLLSDGGKETKVPAQALREGDVIAVRPGERIPADCLVLSGSCSADTSVVTGESMPREMGQGSELLSGMIDLDGLITCRVLRPAGQSAAARIIEMVEDSAKQKGNTERFITRFARVYTPAVLVVAVLVAVLPPLLSFGSFTQWIHRALVFLVASCPCALVISVPLSFFSAIGAASKQGVLVKGGKYIELLSKAKNLAFDKTGTLTQGQPGIAEINCYGSLSEQAALSLAALAERGSTHPLAKALTEACPELPACTVEAMKEHSGYGLELTIQGRQVLCGSSKLMGLFGVECGKAQGENVLLAVDGKLEAGFRMKDQLRPDAAQAIAELKGIGFETVCMVSGDNEQACAQIAQESGVTEYAHSCLPGDKVEKVKGLKAGGTTLFVGDGINDAPVLAAADAGIAMGLGSQAAIEAADVVLMSQEMRDLPKAVTLARRSMGVIRFNVAFALAVKLAVFLLAFTGYAQMWMAVFADVGVSILSVLNASRILLFTRGERK